MADKFTYIPAADGWIILKNGSRFLICTGVEADARHIAAQLQADSDREEERKSINSRKRE